MVRGTEGFVLPWLGLPSIAALHPRALHLLRPLTPPPIQPNPLRALTPPRIRPSNFRSFLFLPGLCSWYLGQGKDFFFPSSGSSRRCCCVIQFDLTCQRFRALRLRLRFESALAIFTSCIATLFPGSSPCYLLPGEFRFLGGQSCLSCFCCFSFEQYAFVVFVAFLRSNTNNCAFLMLLYASNHLFCRLSSINSL